MHLSFARPLLLRLPIITDLSFRRRSRRLLWFRLPLFGQRVSSVSPAKFIVDDGASLRLLCHYFAAAVAEMGAEETQSGALGISACGEWADGCSTAAANGCFHH